MWIHRNTAKARFKGLLSCYPVKHKGRVVHINAMTVYRWEWR